MRKLKLESVTVESFATVAAASTVSGTMHAHQQDPYPTTQTYDVRKCGETQYFDCTFGCPSINRCELTEGVECWA